MESESVWFLLVEAVGATLVFTQGSIFKGLRSRGPRLWREFSSCALCVGVWVGMLLRWRDLQGILGPAGAMPSTFDWMLALLGFGGATGAIALTIVRLWEFCESSSVYDDLQAETHRRAQGLRKPPAP